jgi:flagellar basal body-associated protein FliL
MNAHSEPTSTPPGQKRHGVVWTVVAIIAGLVILVPVALFLLLVVGFGIADSHHPTVGEAYSAVQQYYKAIQRHDYTAAYAYMDPHATMTVNGQDTVVDSATTLAALTQAADQTKGAITAYTLSDGNFELGKPIVDMTVQVTRGATPYDVHIQISMIKGKWRILRLDHV